MRYRLLLLLAPILSMCVLTLGNGFYTTLTTVQLGNMQQPIWMVGFISVTYFAGMMVGSYFSQKVIVRIGFIRSYALFAATTAVATLLQGMLEQIYFWALLRFIAGYALAGLFLVIESWCIDSAGSDYKGRILSLYLFAYYCSQAASQLLLNINFSNELMAFCVISLLASLSILPVSLTRFNVPSPETLNIVSPWKYFKKIPLGILSSFVAGMMLGGIYTMLPLFLKDLYINNNLVAYAMGATILGGMMLQLPIGKLSDIFDRRKVLLGVSLGGSIAAIIACFVSDYYIAFIILTFLLGGFSFTIYPLSISHSSDLSSKNEIVSVVGVLTIAYGVGSMLGPIFITAFMKIFDLVGIFIFFAMISLLLSLYTIWRLSIKAPVKDDDKITFTSMSPENVLVGEYVLEQQLQQEDSQENKK